MIGGKNARVEISVTDGKDVKRLIWINQTTNGIYAGFCRKGLNCYNSYHSGGEVHGKCQGKITFRDKKQKLEGFSGFTQLCFLGVSFDFNKTSEAPPYKLKTSDHTLYLDSRKYPTKSIGCSIHLLGRGEIGKVEEVISKMKARESHILTNFQPWLAVILTSVKVI